MAGKGMLIVISGPSGSGKDTVVRALDPSREYAHSVSVTTRKKRENETEGKDYFFKTPEEFALLRDSGQLMEHALFCGNYYGTPRSFAEKQIESGKIMLLTVEVEGALQIREQYNDSVHIFILPPSMEELSRRLTTRGTDKTSEIEERLKRAGEEIILSSKYDYLVINRDVKNAARQIDAIITAEFLKTGRNREFISNYLKGGAGEC